MTKIERTLSQFFAWYFHVGEDDISPFRLTLFVLWLLLLGVA